MAMNASRSATREAAWGRALSMEFLRELGRDAPKAPPPVAHGRPRRGASSSSAGMTRFKFSGVDLSTGVHPGAEGYLTAGAPTPAGQQANHKTQQGPDVQQPQGPAQHTPVGPEMATLLGFVLRLLALPGCRPRCKLAPP